MDPFLLWLESTAFSTWLRESVSVFAFPVILTFHTVGMGVVAGFNGALALRILGAAPGVPIQEMKRFFPFMWAGFWLNAMSGVALLIGYPTKALTNPMFYFKLILVAIGLVVVRKLNGRVFGDVALDEAASQQVRKLAMASLACWSGVIISGRLLAYTYSRLLADF